MIEITGSGQRYQIHPFGGVSHYVRGKSTWTGKTWMARDSLALAIEQELGAEEANEFLMHTTSNLPDKWSFELLNLSPALEVHEIVKDWFEPVLSNISVASTAANELVVVDCEKQSIMSSFYKENGRLNFVTTESFSASVALMQFHKLSNPSSLCLIRSDFTHAHESQFPIGNRQIVSLELQAMMDVCEPQRSQLLRSGLLEFLPLDRYGANFGSSKICLDF